MEAASPETRPRRIALINQKGGVGKTTTTANLGAALARSGERVLLIDLDPQSHLSLHFGVAPESAAGVYDVLVDETVRPADALHEIEPGLALLPASVNLAGLETELADALAAGEAQTRLRDRLAPLWGPGGPGFDTVLVDCPPSLGLLTVSGLVLASEVLVPLQPHFLALQSLSRLLETVQQVAAGLNPSLAVTGVILCMHDGQTVLARDVAADVARFLAEARGQPVPWRDARLLDPPIRRNVRLAESPGHGATIFDYAPSSAGAADYTALAERLRGRRGAGSPEGDAP